MMFHKMVKKMRCSTPAQPSDLSSRSILRQRNYNPMLSRMLSARASFFILFNIFYSFVFFTHFARLLRFAHEQPHYPHFFLILLVSFWLLFMRWKALYTCTEYYVQGGVLLMLPGSLCYVLGVKLEPVMNSHDFMALSTSGMVIAWIGGFVTFLGGKAAKVAIFPLSFLIFIIPLPEKLLYTVITALQYASAEMTALLFHLTPLPVFREGLVFVLPGLTIEVARECSSIRSSMALLITGVLVSHLFLRRWWSRSIILALVYPLAVLKNGIRIVALCLLTLQVDRGFMTGHLHTRGGAVFFGLALVIMLGLLVGLRKLETRQSSQGQQPRCPKETS